MEHAVGKRGGTERSEAERSGAPFAEGMRNTPKPQQNDTDGLEKRHRAGAKRRKRQTKAAKRHEARALGFFAARRLASANWEAIETHGTPLTTRCGITNEELALCRFARCFGNWETFASFERFEDNCGMIFVKRLSSEES